MLVLVVVCFVVVVSVLSLAVENLRCRSSRGLVNERPAMISTQVAAARYERGSYGNKADFDFIQRLAKRLHDAGACERESNGRLAVMMGGVNEGQAPSVLAGGCEGLLLVGFEIVRKTFEVARAKLHKYPNVVVINEGFSNVSSDVSTGVSDIGGEGSFLGEGGIGRRWVRALFFEYGWFHCDYEFSGLLRFEQVAHQRDSEKTEDRTPNRCCRHRRTLSFPRQSSSMQTPQSVATV